MIHITETPTEESVAELLNSLELYAEWQTGKGMVTVMRFDDFSENFDPWQSQRVLDILALAG